MSIQLIVTCDKCGKHTDIEVQQGTDINKVTVKDSPRFFSYSELPLGNHICFDCSMKVLENDQE